MSLTLWLGKIWQFAIGKITSQELLADPNCATQSAKSVSTSRTGSHAREGVIHLRENLSTISSLVLLLGLISQFPTNELKVATNAQKRLRINYDSVTMSKNALGIWHKSRTIFRIGEFVAKVLNSSKLLRRIPDRPTNCKNGLCESVKIFTNWVRFSHESKYLLIRGNSEVLDNRSDFKFLHFANVCTLLSLKYFT